MQRLRIEVCLFDHHCRIRFHQHAGIVKLMIVCHIRARHQDGRHPQRRDLRQRRRACTADDQIDMRKDGQLLHIVHDMNVRLSLKSRRVHRVVSSADIEDLTVLLHLRQCFFHEIIDRAGTERSHHDQDRAALRVQSQRTKISFVKSGLCRYARPGIS